MECDEISDCRSHLVYYQCRHLESLLVYLYTKYVIAAARGSIARPPVQSTRLPALSGVADAEAPDEAAVAV